MILRRDFFNRNSVVVAKDLVGKFLVRKVDGKIFKYLIVETESYEGLKDKASHASRGKTLRNAPMFEEAGTIYVYFTYGMHYMLNIVCGPKGHPSAVLIRGISPSLTLPQGEGIKKGINLIGPARLTKYLKIDKNLNNKKLGKATGLWIEDYTKIHGRGKVYKTKLEIIKTPRIGVNYAGPIWSQKKYRFVLKDFETKKF